MVCTGGVSKSGIIVMKITVFGSGLFCFEKARVGNFSSVR
jgi:hypothetical protein